MLVVTVAPLSRGVFKERLTYYTTGTVQPGQVVTVSIRSRETAALVLETEDLRDAKSRLRSAPYEVRKFDAAGARFVVPGSFVAAAHETARYSATTTGLVLQSLIPKPILSDEPGGLAGHADAKRVQTSSGQNVAHEMYVYQADDQERMATYKSFIRSQFAQNRSIFFCVPTIGHLDRVVASLGKGIDQYMFVVHGKLSAKEIRARWKALLAEDHPVLIVGTPSFLGVPRADLGALILDYENAKAYKQSTRPFLDIRTFAEAYATQAKLTLVMGDVLLRTETLARHEDGAFAEFAPLKFRVLSQAKKEIIDMQSITDEAGDPSFRILSDELIELGHAARRENGNLLVVANRKGLNPITVCADCGTVLRCENCSAPVTLHTRNDRRLFICHKCGARRDAHERCAVCESWRLTPLGIGTELIEAELGTHIPDATIMRLDGDTATTAKRAQAMVAKFFETPGSIMVATEMAIPYLTQNVDRIAVASIDSLFALPDFRVNERVFNLLLRLYVRASKHFLVQTRHSGSERLFDYIARGNVIDFYRAELEDRKAMGYPPFKTFIKVTLEGARDEVRRKMEHLAGDLAEFNAIAYPAFTQEVKGKYRMHLLIKMDHGAWVHEALLEKLRALPPQYLINVDPEDLL